MAITSSPGQVTPDFGPAVLHPHVDSVTLTDSAFNSTAVIPIGASFFLRVDLAVDGPLAVLWPTAWHAHVFLNRIDAPGNITLGPFPFVWPNPGATLIPLGPFLTPGDVPSGLWRISLDLDPDAAPVAAVVSAFIDGSVIEVTP